METMDDQRFLDSLDPDDLSLYREVLMKEYLILSENVEAFIHFDKMTDMDKVSKIQDMYDLICLEDEDDPRLDSLIEIIDLISIKNLKNKNIQ